MACVRVRDAEFCWQFIWQKKIFCLLKKTLWHILFFQICFEKRASQAFVVCRRPGRNRTGLSSPTRWILKNRTLQLERSVLLRNASWSWQPAKNLHSQGRLLLQVFMTLRFRTHESQGWGTWSPRHNFLYPNRNTTLRQNDHHNKQILRDSESREDTIPHS